MSASLFVSRSARLFCATHALALVLALPTPVHAAEPKKPAKPVLSCKLKGADGLTYTVIKPGKGDKPGANARVAVNYRGMLQSNGTEFDSGNGAKFKISGVIKGFGQGLQLMQPGGKYRICIPAAIAYGDQETGSIPANSNLVFEVDLLSFETLPPKPIIPAEARTCNAKTASGLNYAIEKAGTGQKPTADDMVLVDMTAIDPITGEIMMRREWERLPMAQTAAPFNEGFALMPEGSAYRFCMAARQGENGESNPAVTFRIDMLAIRPVPEEIE